MTPTDPRMDQRLDFLESSNRWCLFALDVAASLVNIHGRLSYTRNPNLILEEAQKYLRRLMVDFDATCFFLVNEDDHSFIQQNCQPSEKSNMMDELLDRLIEKGEFAWALNQNKTIIARTRSPDDSPVLLHVLATQCRVRGMFVAVLAHHEEPLSRSMDNLLTIILHNTAYALESAELYRMLDDLNRSLEERVHESLQQIMEQKRELEDKLTELRKVKESLAVAKEAAEAASRSKSTFLATISHEIRTPMNAIIGMNQLLLEADLPQQQREYAQIVSRAGESLMTLLNDVLDISKIEANQITIHQHPFALRSMLDGVVEILAVSAREKKLALQLKVDGAIPPYLVGDTARLRQVLFNLGINAIKFTQQGEVSLSLHQETGGRVRFSLQDSGIGISPEHLP
ncbi:MAG: hypothetical protein G8345_07090, partial [Magnetococcales bacterium]|nr:hypothetical protein [Magnetococcales bacterium]